MEPLLIICIFSGALGGAMFHCYWLISLSDFMSGKALETTRNDSIFRIKALFLKAAVGSAAGFITGIWFIGMPEIVYNKVAVYAFLSGLSGEGFLGFLKKMTA